MVAVAAPDDATARGHTSPIMRMRETAPLLATEVLKPQQPDYRTATKTSSTSSVLRNASMAQWFIVLSIAAYTFAHTIVAAPGIQLTYFNMLDQYWWEAPSPANNGAGKQHYEMIKATYFTVYCIVPFTIATVIVESLRDAKLKRVTSRQVMQIGLFMRRKPTYGHPWLRKFSYGELLFLTAFIGGNVLMFITGWSTYSRNFPVPGTEYTIFSTLEIIGIVLGYNCVYNMAFLFLPATRNSAWMEFMGISYANGMKYHRWLGVLTLVTGVGHGLPFYFVWAHQDVLYEKSMPCFDCSLDWYSSGYPTWFNVFGEISLIFMVILGVTSLPWIRRRMYETFYYSHYLFIPCVVFAVLHWGPIVWWILPTFMVYLVDRVVSSTNALAPVQVEECVVLSDDILKIVVTRSSERDGNFQVGQFVYLNVPAISKWQWHAFTIGSSPRTSATSFTILLKALGDWTDDLMKYAHECELKKETPVMYVDGYYGSSLEMYDQYATLCLIGGGIGVTPLFAMLEDIAALLDESAQQWPTRKVHFVFTFRELSLLEEIHPVLQKLKSADPRGEVFTYDFYLTRAPAEGVLDQVIGQASAAAKAAARTPAEVPSICGIRRSACPFAEPLRSRTYRAVLYSTMVVGAAALVTRVDYGGGFVIDYGAKSQYWPLQNLMDIVVLFVIAPVAYLFVLVDKLVAKRRKAAEVADKEVDPSSVQVQSQYESSTYVSSDVATYRDLVAEYNVAVGARPNMATTMDRVYGDYQTVMASKSQPDGDDLLSKTVGVFISGPEALKRATDDAAATLGTSFFDIHDEEFEL
ncbi:hypothetical protein Poli38472_000642 [Pythium oligandrum]|uniref:FAD-binding FR-type domain-containing protein n=1 Tax=Pythium oligandrum TaxID=41045 RepID=A0A8K1FEJ0_PYTOL|nr:hypothetical protein Poli38472_000642 [Pythium oligandrum]|eukprot:TMW60600.1 hypothetical protein Poli38472_000642 [Pythium oligandrum]